MSNFFEFLFILKFVTKKLHAQCACRLENLLAQRKKCMHLCMCKIEHCFPPPPTSVPVPVEPVWTRSMDSNIFFVIYIRHKKKKKKGGKNTHTHKQTMFVSGSMPTLCVFTTKFTALLFFFFPTITEPLQRSEE